MEVHCGVWRLKGREHRCFFRRVRPAAASKAVSTWFLEDPECADVTSVTRYTVSAITCFC